MKKLITTIVLLNFSFGFSQDKVITEEQIVFDSFIHITFKENKSTLTKKNKELLNNIGKFISDNIEKKYEYRFEVIPSQKEKKDIEYERVKVVINYLKDNFNIEKSSLTFHFLTLSPLIL